MLGLKIHDQLRWHDRWSSEIGRRLTVRDSSNDLYIFDERHTREEIAAVLPDAPADLYDLFEVSEGPEENCDFMADSGRCYFRQ
jgi:hypothetical protein